MADDDLPSDDDFDEDKVEAVEDVSEDDDNESTPSGEESDVSKVESDSIEHNEDESEGNLPGAEDNESSNGSGHSNSPNVDTEKLEPDEGEAGRSLSENEEKDDTQGEKESDASDLDTNNIRHDESKAAEGSLEVGDELSDEPNKKPKKKIIIISSVSLVVLLVLSAGGFVMFSGASGGEKFTKGAVIPPPGYLASVAVPPKKRKRMKTGRELSQDKASLKSPKMRRENPKLDRTEHESTQSKTEESKAFGQKNRTGQDSSSLAPTKASPPTVQVIGARVVPGKGLMMPSVTAASYQAVPMKAKSQPVSSPDESLMETIDGKVLPKMSESGKTPWQTYSYRFTPTLQPAALGAEGADAKPKEYARISIIIRGLGLNRNATLAAINKLPAAISLSFSPYAKGLEEWAGLARGAGHEILMSLPMEPIDFPSSDAGPMALLTDLDLEQNTARLASIMNLTQAYVGFVQNMGSRFATSEAAFKPMLKILKDRGLLFVDDGLVKGGLAPRIAVDISLPHARSDMIIDDNASGIKIAQNLLQLETIAKKNQSTLGLAKKNQTAIGIGEAYPATLAQINRWVKTLKTKMIDLAPITAVVRENFVKAAEAAAGEADGEKTKKEQ